MFGCGGDRDPGKRPLMGGIAEAAADLAIVTDDNPRTESSATIIEQILGGMRDPARAHVVPDRAEAIRHALDEAEPGDVVVVAGKGHEEYQIVGTETRPFSDRETCSRASDPHPTRVPWRGRGSAMITRDLQTFARVTGGTLHGANATFDRVQTDSRALEPDALFVALAGDRFDGHDFVAATASLGAAGAVVSRRVDCALPQVRVPDTLDALSRFSHAWRRSFAGVVVGITGSNGKTTVKEMTGAILAELGPCLVTQGNLNNHIGVPLTLCRLDDAHRSAVIEMGANHLLEIAHLAALARPAVGLVINAGPAHLEGFGGIDGVARGKGEMFEALDTDGTAVINADDRFATFWHGLARRAGRVVTFGVHERADVTASNVRSRLGDVGFHDHVRTRDARGQAHDRTRAGRRTQRHECAGRDGGCDGGRCEPRRGRARLALDACGRGTARGAASAQAAPA